jgi:uncharacterized protein with NAD-binding domain and iron-sulfur cluster
MRGVVRLVHYISRTKGHGCELRVWVELDDVGFRAWAEVVDVTNGIPVPGFPVRSVSGYRIWMTTANPGRCE